MAAASTPREPRPATAGRAYRCSGCDSQVTLFLRAAYVACSRCGRRMRELRAH